MAAEDDEFLDIPPLSASEKKTAKESGESKSTQEVKQLASGRPARDLKREADENEAARTERFRDHFEGLAIVTLYIVWIGLVIFGLIWAYHLVAPTTWSRLPDEQIGNMQAILAGGVIGLATSHIKRRMGS